MNPNGDGDGGGFESEGGGRVRAGGLASEACRSVPLVIL